MERRVYTPIEYIPQEVTKPVIFLAGPIQGAADWQSQATESITKTSRNLIIASPRKTHLDQSFHYTEQVEWETFHLKRAGENGAIMFWLPIESKRIEGRAYAQTSRVEFGEWVNEHKHNKNVKLVVGIEAGFTGARYFRYKLEPFPEIPILDNLEETCMNAIRLAKQKHPK